MKVEDNTRVESCSTHNDEVIKGFFKEYRFLSNFHMVPIEWEGIVYPSTEHAYQAAKSKSVQERLRIADLETPNQARLEGRKLAMRTDWEQVKIAVMTEINRIKYSDPSLSAALLVTGDTYLEETNWWKDTFWGTCDGVGENHLGKVLMLIRSEIRDSN
jgi:ribA/ribD-fused uncharacterized protein